MSKVSHAAAGMAAAATSVADGVEAAPAAAAADAYRLVFLACVSQAA